MALEAVVKILALCLVVGRVAAQFTIDQHAADGTTTYCKLTNGTPTPPYTMVKTGKCPVTLQMSVSRRSSTAVTAVFDVYWNVSMNPNRSEEEYPLDAFKGELRALDSIYACKADSDCTDNEDRVDSVAKGDDDVVLVSLDVTNTSAVKLMSYRLRLPPSGDYVIVGHVALRSFNYNMIDNFVWQQVSTTGNLTPGTVKPAQIEPVDTVTPTVSSVPPTTIPPTGTTTVPISTKAPDQGAAALETLHPTMEAQAAGDGNVIEAAASSSSSNGPGNAMTAGLLAGVAVAALVVAVMYFVVSRKHE